MTRPDTSFTGPELCAKPAREIVTLLRSGDLTTQDLIKASLTRMDQVEPQVNAVVTRCPERARARPAPKDSLLAGLPIGIKDLSPVEGVRTTFGTKGMANHVPTASDPLVLRLESRGGVVLGKTNTPEMGAGANTFNAVFGATRNPWNTAMNAAGSSGGAAVSLATGELWLSHGSDFGGSLRSPANYCGIVGLRPSPGIAGGSSAHLGFTNGGVEGPMARDVLDCALFLDAMAGFDPVWPISFPAPDRPYLETARQDAGTIRIAYTSDLNGFAAVTSEIDTVLRSAIDSLRLPSIEVEEYCPDLPRLDETFRALRCLSFMGSYQVTPESVTRHYKDTIKGNLADARAMTFDDYAQAERDRAAIYNTMAAFFETHDVLACPVNGLAPLPVEIEYPTEVAGRPMRDYIDWLQFAFLATVAGLPALSLPVGFTPSGMPVGLQLIGPPRGEARLLQVAHTLEQALSLPVTLIDPITS
ncbi:amidase family protein [Marivita sp. XM-24bin2]|uniref:amidase n=1 Tax=unclassified Marivita TaxID=2632480 RepID=UPI0025BCD764|nr:amidase family protein [Marivita sp. XM-24bin2]MCR9111141.1 amidase family protein [Paracoccaceae bacterium]